LYDDDMAGIEVRRLRAFENMKGLIAEAF